MYLRKISTYLKNVWPLLGLLWMLLSCSESPRDFTSFLYDLAEIDVENRSELLEEWIKKQEEFPLINGNDVYFLFREKREVPVLLSGSMIGSGAKGEALMQIIGTEYYYTRQNYPGDAAFEYKFIVNGRHLLDPFNKKIFKSENELLSLLFMPDYVYPVETLTRINKAYTDLDTLSFNNSAVYFYRHPLCSSDSPVVVFLNGEKYLQLAEANIILDNLIDSKKMMPVSALFCKETTGVMDLLSYVANELNLSLKHTIAGGKANDALFLFKNPHIMQKFDSVFLQSMFSKYDSLHLSPQSRQIDLSSTRVFLSYGQYENQDSLYSKTIEFLSEKTNNFKVEKYHEGASWLNWKGHLDDALIYCLNRNLGSNL